MAIRGEYDERLEQMKIEAAATTVVMKAHIEADAKAFTELVKQLTEVNADVKSIIVSRAFAAGIWKAITMVLGSGMVVAFFAMLWKVFSR